MTIINRERYYCSATRERGTCDSTVGIKATDLENRVLTGIKDTLLGNEDPIDAFVTESKAEVARLRRQRGTRERQSPKELNKVNTAIKRCLTFITEGDGDPGLVRDELKVLEARKRDLEHSIKSTHEEAAVEIHPNMADLYRKKVMELQSLLSDDTSRPQAMELIRSMIERIEVHIGEERGKPNAILVGALAQIPAFTQPSKTAASGGDGGRVLMVAGARKQRESLILPVRL